MFFFLTTAMQVNIKSLDLFLNNNIEQELIFTACKSIIYNTMSYSPV